VYSLVCSDLVYELVCCVRCVTLTSYWLSLSLVDWDRTLLLGVAGRLWMYTYFFFVVNTKCHMFDWCNGASCYIEYMCIYLYMHVYQHPSTYTVVSFRKIRDMSNFKQVGWITYVQSRESSWNPDSNTMEPDRPQHDGTASVNLVLSPNSTLPPP
jgi:hypothetical protein